jgi:hypothetical protein
MAWQSKAICPITRSYEAILFLYSLSLQGGESVTLKLTADRG